VHGDPERLSLEIDTSDLAKYSIEPRGETLQALSLLLAGLEKGRRRICAGGPVAALRALVALSLSRLAELGSVRTRDDPGV